MATARSTKENGRGQGGGRGKRRQKAAASTTKIGLSKDVQKVGQRQRGVEGKGVTGGPYSLTAATVANSDGKKDG